MTDTTDIKALRELLCHEDLESDYHVGVTVTTLRLLLSKADALEAERQRADDAERKNSLVAGGIESALKLQERAEKAEDEVAALKTDIESYISINGELATEVEVLKAKLENPVVLHNERDDYQDTDEYEQGYVRGYNASRRNSVADIEKSGFTVKGE